MKKYTLLALSLATIVGLVGLASCSKDDPAPPRQTVSFERSTQTITEAAGAVEVNVLLDIAAGEDISVDYDVAGTALEGTDYQITSTSGKVTIKKGQTKGVIELSIKNDTGYEGDETIELEISSVSSTNVDIAEDSKIVVTITEDDPQPIASFKTSTGTFNEDTFEVDVEVSLDHIAGEDIKLTYTIDNQDQWLDDRSIALSAEYGTTQDFPSNYFDFFIDVEDEGGTEGQVTIYKGDNSGVIKVRLYTDFFLEGNEVISLTLTGAANNAAAIATAASKKTTKITVQQQDGTSIQMAWASTSADMNLYLVAGENETQLSDWNNNYLLGISTYQQKSTDPIDYAIEDVFLPTNFSNILPDLDTWGLSFSYRAGNVDDLDFRVGFFDYVDGDIADNGTIYEGVYKLANVYDPTVQGSNPPIIEQTFTFVDGVISDISDIEIPATASRVRSSYNPLLVSRSAQGSLVDASGREVARIAGMSGSYKIPVMRSNHKLNLLRR